MQKEKGVQTLIIAVLAVAILVMSVGFATYSSSLNLNGNITVKKSTWMIEFDNETYNETTGSVAASSESVVNNTQFNFAATLEKPGDFYEATIDIKNSGTFDAKLTGITVGSLDSTQSNYLQYTLTYNDVAFTGTSDEAACLSKLGADGVKLDAGASKTVKVRVTYIQPNDETLLPQTDQTVYVTGSFDYSQVTA